MRPHTPDGEADAGRGGHGRHPALEGVGQAGGDVGFRRLLADTAEIAGRGLGMIGAILNPGLILIGGRAALAGEALLAPLVASYERHTLIKREETPEAQRARIEIARFPHNHALLGAVALVLRRHGRLS